MNSKPCLRELPTTTSHQGRPGQTITLKHYEVSVDGEVIGRVSQHRAQTMNSYSGKTYGYATYRTCWQWEAEIGGGDYEIRTRTQAITDLVEYVAEQA